jgi:hypothetical protein
MDDTIYSKFTSQPTCFALFNDLIAISGKDILKIFTVNSNALVEKEDVRFGVKLNQKYTTTDIKWGTLSH